MEAHNPSSLQFDFTFSTMDSEAQVELIWQMGAVSLASNNDELVLPKSMALLLSPDCIEELKNRLSLHLNGAATIAFEDHEAQVFRILRVPQLVKTGDSSSTASSPEHTSPPSRMSTPANLSQSAVRAKAHARKSKVPRPPNAFILYRQKFHPIIKQQHSNIHNNQISIILGKQWKSESENVKREYKDLAAMLKSQHAAANPGYQYAPRKPSEKKKRMTARKLAKLQSTNMLDVADHERAGAGDESQQELESDGDMSEHSTGIKFPCAEDYLGTARPNNVNCLDKNPNGYVKITLPANASDLQNRIVQHTSNIDPTTAQPFNSANNEQVMSASPAYVTNDQDFFDSLVDWEGIAADAALIRSATNEELAELADLELGNPYLDLTADQQRAAFEQELQRTMHLFE